MGDFFKTNVRGVGRILLFPPKIIVFVNNILFQERVAAPSKYALGVGAEE